MARAKIVAFSADAYAAQLDQIRACCEPELCLHLGLDSLRAQQPLLCVCVCNCNSKATHV